jgi:hypothetical protein
MQAQLADQHRDHSVDTRHRACRDCGCCHAAPRSRDVLLSTPPPSKTNTPKNKHTADLVSTHPNKCRTHLQAQLAEQQHQLRPTAAVSSHPTHPPSHCKPTHQHPPPPTPNTHIFRTCRPSWLTSSTSCSRDRASMDLTTSSNRKERKKVPSGENTNLQAWVWCGGGGGGEGGREQMGRQKTRKQGDWSLANGQEQLCRQNCYHALLLWHCCCCCGPLTARCCV